MHPFIKQVGYVITHFFSARVSMQIRYGRLGFWQRVTKDAIFKAPILRLLMERHWGIEIAFNIETSPFIKRSWFNKHCFGSRLTFLRPDKLDRFTTHQSLADFPYQDQSWACPWQGYLPSCSRLCWPLVLFCPDLVSSTIAPSSLTELLPLELLVFWQIRAGELLVGAATLRSSEHFVLLQNLILGKLHGVFTMIMMKKNRYY